MSLDIGNAVIAGAAQASDALTRTSRSAGERTMGAVAHQALFTEALLGAIRARVNELKLVAK